MEEFKHRKLEDVLTRVAQIWRDRAMNKKWTGPHIRPSNVWQICASELEMHINIAKSIKKVE